MVSGRKGKNERSCGVYNSGTSFSLGIYEGLSKEVMFQLRYRWFLKLSLSHLPLFPKKPQLSDNKYLLWRWAMLQIIPFQMRPVIHWSSFIRKRFNTHCIVIQYNQMLSKTFKRSSVNITNQISWKFLCLFAALTISCVLVHHSQRKPMRIGSVL